MKSKKRCYLKHIIDNSTFARYLFVGLIGALLFYSILFIEIYIFEFSYWLSSQLSYIIAVPITFKLHGFFTFRTTTHWIKTFFPYVLASFMVGFLFQLSQEYFMNRFGLPPIIALLVPAPVLTLLNYALLQLGIFRKPVNVID